MKKNTLQIIGILFACLFPSILTLVYFDLLANHSVSLQKGVYAIGKILQFTFPLWFLAFVMKSKLKIPLKFTRKIAVGVLFGASVGALMIILFNSPLFSGETMSALQVAVQGKISGLGLDSTWNYLALALFYAILHSLLEEYYWRWFVYGQMRERMSLRWARILSSLGFTAHHIILLTAFFGWADPLTYLLVIAIVIGGIFWSWRYEHDKSLISPWLSHLMVDATIFWIGYRLISMTN